ncbi:hypothetical protein K493DRAFT_312216 [Basidiobolus meristosporus CBS 931.73]|uniref:Uncharacterized protein n=1 Tax=Basidiobolus meristosporus CBS 931.73 TaxID=1314790 RepID=A0A1Y1YV66_9FUNG|nr:hypothetical protein K493DRAFT_312216 [Basidiobolus meristosporus CBS 931.73]|eukprot:ORY01922.1 hypothetical protein K493DRAFT_312216 [Basidiobolus meristosporus CBS 931.73]
MDTRLCAVSAFVPIAAWPLSVKAHSPRNTASVSKFRHQRITLGCCFVVTNACIGGLTPFVYGGPTLPNWLAVYSGNVY